MDRTIDACYDVSLVPDYAIDVGSRRIVRFDLVDRTADGAIVAMATGSVVMAVAVLAGNFVNVFTV